MTWLLAHQGGWDELLMFAVPAVLAVLGLRWAEKRSRARREGNDPLRPTPPPELGEGDEAVREERGQDAGL